MTQGKYTKFNIVNLYIFSMIMELFNHGCYIICLSFIFSVSVFFIHFHACEKSHNA